MLNDVLDFSKIEAGRLDLSPIEFSLRQCVARNRARCCGGRGRKRDSPSRVRIATAVPDRLVGDPDRLRQVLINLIGNAIKFTADGRRVLTSRSTRSRSGRRRRRCSSPCAIPASESRADKQQLIFEAFRQADGSTTRKYGGTGLGLAICSRLVEMMGGAIQVESEPGAAAPSISRRDSASAPPSRRAEAHRFGEPAKHAGGEPGTGCALRSALHILLAEDNPVNQRLAMRLLERRGHAWISPARAVRRSSWLERERFDLILMDVQMPDMDGLEATALIREREKLQRRPHPDRRADGAHHEGDRERCLAAGMDNYINKPIDAVKFLEIVEMRRRRAEQGLTVSSRSLVGGCSDLAMARHARLHLAREVRLDAQHPLHQHQLRRDDASRAPSGRAASRNASCWRAPWPAASRRSRPRNRRSACPASRRTARRLRAASRESAPWCAAFSPSPSGGPQNSMKIERRPASVHVSTP